MPLQATTDVQQFVAVLQDQEFVVKLENYVNLIQEQAEVIVEYKNLTDALKIEVEVLNATVQQLQSEWIWSPKQQQCTWCCEGDYFKV